MKETKNKLKKSPNLTIVIKVWKNWIEQRMKNDKICKQGKGRTKDEPNLNNNKTQQIKKKFPDREGRNDQKERS